MQGLRYLEEAVTLSLDAEKCNGCRMCTLVCPHGVFAIGDDKRAYLADRGACMECGACALNCATGAIAVSPGVGCASAIINGWLTGTEPSCGCSSEGAPGAGSCCGSEPTAGSSCCSPEPTAGSSCCGGSEPRTSGGGGCC